MIGTIVSSSLSEGEFWVLFWATIGAIIVFVGLLLEKFAEWMNDRFLGGTDKPHKTLESVGWCLLMFGICIEIADAGWSANDAWQTRQMAIKNDPLNQPVSDISANMIVKLKGTNFIEGSRLGSGFAVRGTLVNLGGNGKGVTQPWMKPGDVFGFFTVTNGLATIVNGNVVDIFTPLGFETSQFGVLDSDNFERVEYPQENNHGYILFFHKHPKKIDNFEPRRPTAKEVIANTTWLDIWCDFMPTNAQVISGSAEIIINGNLHLEFQILPKNSQAAVVGMNGWGFALVATNAIFPISSSLPPINIMMNNGKIVSPTNGTVIPAELELTP